MYYVKLMIVISGLSLSHLSSAQTEKPSITISPDHVVHVLDSGLNIYGFSRSLFIRPMDNTSQLTTLTREVTDIIQRLVDKQAYYYWNQLLNLPTADYYHFVDSYMEQCPHCKRQISAINREDIIDIMTSTKLGCMLSKELRGSHPDGQVLEYFKLMALLESGLNPVALDKDVMGVMRDIKQEKGLWQLQQHAATGVGQLIVNARDNIDERFNPILATMAARRYMLRAYQKYQQWALVIAYYNWGGPNLDKALAGIEISPKETAGPETLARLWQHLPKVTKNYYRHFFAYFYLLHEYGFGCARLTVDLHNPEQSNHRLYPQLDMQAYHLAQGQSDLAELFLQRQQELANRATGK